MKQHETRISEINHFDKTQLKVAEMKEKTILPDTGGKLYSQS